MKKISYLCSLFCFMFSAVIFAKSYQIGVLEGPGAGGEKKTNMQQLWKVILPYVNQNTQTFQVKYYSQIDQLNDAIRANQVDYAYIQSPGMVKNALITHEKLIPIVSLLTLDQKTRKLSTTVHQYLFTSKHGLNLIKPNTARHLLSNKKIAIASKPYELSVLKEEFKQNNIQWVVLPSFAQAIQYVLTNKADAAIAPDRVFQHFTQQQQNQLSFFPMFDMPNGAILASPSIPKNVTKQLVHHLELIKPETLQTFHVKGFSKPISTHKYLQLIQSNV